MPIVKATKGETRAENKSLPNRSATQQQKANEAARELMKRYIRGRNKDSNIKSYEK